MKITKKQLNNIINEEINLMIENGDLDEGFLDRMKARGSGAASRAGSAMKGAGEKFKGGVAGMRAKAGAALAGGEAGETEQGKKAAALKQQAAATGAGAKEKAQARKIISIVDSHLKNFMKDLTKLGIDLETPGVKGSLSSLKKAVSGSVAKKAGLTESDLRKR